jgi:sterol desaturase/sphingolipid hydroxylase (fatty acid hydroxylase superfamily)
MHQAHHGSAPQYWGKNLGGILAIWDWLIGTLYLPRDDEELPLGLPDGEHLEYDSVTALYLLPFAKATRALRRRVRMAFTKRDTQLTPH